MRPGRGNPAPKRVLATAQALHHHPPQQQPPPPLSRRPPASSSVIPLSAVAPSTKSECKAASAGAQHLHLSHGRLATPAVAHHAASGDSLAAANSQYASINRGKAAQRGAPSSHGDHASGLPSQHPQPRFGGGAPARAAGIPRLTPSKKPPQEHASSSAIARLRGGTAAAPVQYSSALSQPPSSTAKRSEWSEEEDKRRRGRRVAAVPLPKRSPPHKDRVSSASSPAVLGGGRTPPIVSASANVTRRNTEGPHRRRRELPEVGCCGDTITQRHRAEERIQLELVTPGLEQRGPPKSAIHRGEVGRGRNRGGAVAGVGAQAEVGTAPPPLPPGGGSGGGGGAANREAFLSSADHPQQRHHHPQQQPPPQRQQGRRKAAVPPTLQRDPSPSEEEKKREERSRVMVGREEGEEGGRVEGRPRMEGKREEEDVEEECEAGVESGGEGRVQSPLEKQVLALGLEKCALESRLEEVLRSAEASREEVEHLRKEVAALKCQRNADVDALEEENRVLRERLRELAAEEGKAEEALRPEGSALSDSEKEQLLLARSSSGQALSSEAMGCSTEHSVEAGGCDGIPNAVSDSALCPTPEWDKQSSSSLSEVSVACLQDRILQMEETHYSTNEELQATLQELADLQAQLTELQADNERLSEEKSVLLESLCRQTEKLEDTRSRADTLQELLLGAPQSSSLPSDPLDESGDAVREAALANGGGDGTELGECSDREQKLVELLKSAQEERENLLSRLEDLNVQLEEARDAWSSRGEESAHLQDRVRHLESAVEAANAERRELDKELAASKEESSARQIQISRLSTLLDNARAKIEELEQAREVRDKCELDNLLDNARKEKDALESQVASLQEKLSHSQCEVSRLKDSVCSLQEECKVARNNAKSALSDLEYQLEQGRSEMALLAEEVRRQTEEAAGACAQSQRHLEDKRTLKAALSEAQRATLDAERRLNQLKNELEEEKKLREEQNEEWEKFQSDLLVTVRVANDFKNEAKLELEKYVLENRGLKDKVKIFEAEMEKLKAVPRSTSPSPSTNCAATNPSAQSERRGLALRTVSAPSAGVAVGSEGASVGAILSSVMQQQQQQEAMALAVRRQKPGSVSRADSRLSVKSLIESIENATKQVKAGPGGGSRSSSTSSLSSITSADPRGNLSLALSAANASPNISQSQTIPTDSSDSEVFTVGNGSIKTPLRDQQQNNNSNNNQMASLRAQRKAISVSDNMYSKSSLHDTLKGSSGGVSCSKNSDESLPLNTVSILSNKMDFVRRNSYGDLTERKDPLSALVRNGGSRRNALLKWCQNKTVGYRNIDITNFSSSWNDGLAFCALLHTYLPDRIPYDSLGPSEKRKNFSLAFSAAEAVGIPTSLNINEMIQLERPDWQQVMSYVTSIYKHFET